MKIRVARQGAVEVRRARRRAARKRRRASRLDRAKKKVERRLEDAAPAPDGGRPVLGGGKVHYELAERIQATAHGGVGAAHRVAVESGLVAAIDEHVHLLKIHRPYHESDHVLNVAFNALCGGRTLDDIELRRNDEAFLDALGAASIPDPTTAGDFCRRFEERDIQALLDAVNEARLTVWGQQGAEFTEQTAMLDADGTLVPTTGERKQGMDLSYKGVWGYHPLVVSLANTGEPLFIANR